MPLLDTSYPGFSTLAPEPRAALIIVHGLAEYADRYRDIARWLSERRISVFAFDQLGHGQRPGVRTHVARFQEFVEELHTVRRAVRKHTASAPVFLWGHSMGSVVATLAAADAPQDLAGVITTSNSLEIFRRGPSPLNPFFRFASTIAPGVRIPLGLDARKISSDPAVQASYGSDPNIPPTASLRLIVEFAAACERVREIAAQLTLPWLIVHGENDEIAPSKGSNVLFDSLGSKDKRLVINPGLRHEVHNEREPERSQFRELLAAWILARSPLPL